jgi:septum formation protein
MKLYLASRSPRRRRLLRELGLPYSVLTPRVEEDIARASPEAIAKHLAELKVRSVEHRVKQGIVIGVDTIVVLGRETMGKPRSKAEARRMLGRLSGRTHEVISGLCLLRKPDGCKFVTAEVSRVRFRRLSAREIETYVSTPEPYDKAGAYAIQGKAGFFVERIEGDYYNIVGLPVARLLHLLGRLGRKL